MMIRTPTTPYVWSEYDDQYNGCTKVYDADDPYLWDEHNDQCNGCTKEDDAAGKEVECGRIVTDNETDRYTNGAKHNHVIHADANQFAVIEG